MKTKKTLWIFAMAVLLATLALIVNSRVQLSSEIVVGGSEKAFVVTTGLKGPFDDYTEISEASSDKYENLSFPDIDITDWRYILINNANPRTGYTPQVKEIRGTDYKCFDVEGKIMLDKLLSAARAEEFDPYIAEAYISYTTQQQIFNSKASELSWDGKYTYDEAIELAKELVPYPGTSDHQTALSVDIFDKEYEVLDYALMDHKFFKWMDENCARFGFIKRFPENKQDVTGWNEPWHYRYVGVTAAEFIMENGMCFEEFVAHYK